MYRETCQSGKKEKPVKIYLLNLQLAVLKKKIFYGRPSIKWTSWKGNKLLKVG